MNLICNLGKVQSLVESHFSVEHICAHFFTPGSEAIRNAYPINATRTEFRIIFAMK